MSFSTIRPNAQIYILNKENIPSLQIGTVLSVSAPTPKFAPQMPFMQQPQEMVVDVTARVGESTGTFFKLSANADVTDYDNGKLTLSVNRDAMNAEVASLKQRAIGIINSVDLNRRIIEGCEAILNDLNPEYAEKQQQAAEIASLKSQMNELLAMNKELVAALRGGNEGAKSVVEKGKPKNS